MTPTTAYTLLQKDGKRGKCSFGCPTLDAAFGGGLSIHGITEIAGEAGSGKTQLCLQLSYQCQLAVTDGGLDGNVAYLTCGEGEFPISRYCELIRERGESYPSAQSIHFLDGLNIEKCHTVDDMVYSLQKRIPSMCETKNLKLLIIDSIAGLVRTEYDARDMGDMMERTKVLFGIAGTLKWLADIFAISIVVVNQVRDDFEGGQHGGSSGPRTTSALGLVWSHCVNARFLLERLRRSELTTNCVGSNNRKRSLEGVFSSDDNELNDNNIDESSSSSSQQKDRSASSPTATRNIMLQFSPSLPYAATAFEIVAAGIQGIN